MDPFAVVQNVTNNGVRKERGDDQSFALPLTEGRNGFAIQSGNPEAALIIFKALWPSEAHPS